MNTSTGLEPIPIRGFKGLWARGTMGETCPKDHLLNCVNCVFPGPGQVATRTGFKTNISLAPNCAQFFQAALAGGLQLIYMDGNGRMYNQAGVNIKTFLGATAFVAINLFSRTYFCPTTAGGGFPGEVLYYYDGVSVKKAAGGQFAGVPPATITLAQANPGVVDAGIHHIAVCYESPTGFLTPPSGFTQIGSLGAKDIEVSTIPVDGSATAVARVLLMSKANSTEYFFTGVRIPNNVTTTAVINKSDTDLVVSADYLNDVLMSVPAGAALRFYKGRLVVVGPVTGTDEVILSNVEDIETFNSVTGVILPPTEKDGNTMRTCWEIRDVLYLAKFTGTFSTQDNGGDPSTWTVSTVDYGYGCYDAGLSALTSAYAGRDVLDSVFIAHTMGLFLFDGVYRERPLSYKIQDLWEQIDFNSFFGVKVAHDVWRKQVYILIPTNNAFRIQFGTATVIFVMDYTEGLSYDTVKWSVWAPLSVAGGTTFSIDGIGMAYLPNDGFYTLRISSTTTSSFYGLSLTGNNTDDVGMAYLCLIRTAPIYIREGYMSVFTMFTFRYRATLTNSILVALYASDGTIGTIALPIVTNDRSIAKGYNKLCENISLEIQTTATNAYVTVTGIDVFGRPLYLGRPNNNL